MLRCINRIEDPTEGEVFVDGTNMAGELRGGRLIADTSTQTARKRQRVGMVFQRFNLFAHLTALDIVAIGPRRVLRMPREESRQIAGELLERVKLKAHADKRPWQLSGGQQQRVAIARALAMQPVLMLFDDPRRRLIPSWWEKCSRSSAISQRTA